ncbi:MAG: hypothetical protein ACI9ES_002260 [Oceanospirillaceae bacterium]|jgi:hypothetical protein
MFNQKNKSFVSLCVEGHALCDDIDDFIDEWHDSDSNDEIFEFLGMSEEEYKLWLHEPDIIYYVITARIKGCLIKDVLTDFEDHRMAARADSPDKAKFLMKWLKENNFHVEN